MRKKIRPLVRLVRKYPYFWISFVVGIGLFMLLLDFGYRRTVAFSYDNPHCTKDLTVLPGFYVSPAKAPYDMSFAKVKSLGGYPLIAQQTCFKAKEAPDQKKKASVIAKLFGIPGFGKRYAISASNPPRLNTEVLAERISVRDPLVFELDRMDRVFEYSLLAEGKSTSCATRDLQVICDVSAMQLVQNQQYSMALIRQFEGQDRVKITEKNVTTVDPVVIATTSIAQNEVVYDKRSEIRLVTNKKIANAQAELLQKDKDKKQPIESKLRTEGNQIIIEAKNPLARNASFELVLNDARAEDKGVILQPFVLSFSVSGGPHVKSASAGKTGAPVDKGIVLAFDQPLEPKQDLEKIVSVSNVSGPVAVKLSVNDKKLTITPQSAMPLCSNFTIKLTNELQSNYGVSGNSAWVLESKTICYSISTIGYSVRGRAIQAWRFGSGPRKILYVGTTHGNERSTKALLEKWIAELDANATIIPSDVTVLIIPNVSPDGYEANSRRNANGVDLNRNFPANDWKADVTIPGGTFVAGGGGSSPLSEPESKTLADYVLAQRPSLVLTYHSAAALVTANKSGNSIAQAQVYSQLSRYDNVPHDQNSEVFLYDTTGAFEDWLHDKLGISAILIELASSSRDEFSRNKEAMKSMLK